MKKMNYIKAVDLKDAVIKIEENALQPLAGGTDILGTIYDRIHEEPVNGLVNLKTLGLDTIREEGNELKIGATVKLADVADNPLVRSKWKLLADAAKTVASPQIRHMATIGGNICQEPRCWYYRYQDNKFDCLRKGGNWCPALTGNNVYHSIFGAVRVCDTGCRTGCPNDTDIALYMELIRKGDIDSAARVLFSVNPIPSVTGRICPHTCMDDCGREPCDEPVAIEHVERFLGDYILEHADTFYTPPEVEKERRVAVVGAGPAGLSTAWFLRRQGYRVTVFDVHTEAGGMLRYSIPAYRLPRDIIGRIVVAMKKAGVVFALGNENCDSAKRITDYAEKFDAVFVGTGAQASLSGGILGEEHAVSGLKFLYDISTEAITDGETLGNVLVIGGGDVAMDVAVSAKRLGARSVNLVYRRTKELMPAHPWELDQAIEEGVGLQTSLAPVEIVAENDRVIGLKVAASKSGRSRSSKTEIDLSDTKILEADTIILAIGQRIESSFHEEFLGTEENGRIKTTQPDCATNVDGVFAGGDVVNGPATIVEAIAQGRRAADGITVYFGDDALPTYAELIAKSEDTPSLGTTESVPLDFDTAALSESEAAIITLPPLESRALSVDDNPRGLSADEIKREACRCLNCGCVAVSASDVAVALLALDASIQTTKRIIPASAFFAASVKSTTVLEPGEIVTEVVLPQMASDVFMEYRKFRPRKTIDFPVLSVAVVIEKEGATVKRARVVLGAVGALPLRATAAESFLPGKKIDESVAAEAAALALQRSVPLAENAYKIQIAKALVRRSILAAR